MWCAICTMRYCVVNNCPGKSGTGVSFYTFPRDVEQREKWVQFVRRSGRPDWVTKKRSELCSLHFSTDCYSENPDYLEMFGLSKRHAFLLPGSLPTILPDATATTIRRRRKRDVRTLLFTSHVVCISDATLVLIACIPAVLCSPVQVQKSSYEPSTAPTSRLNRRVKVCDRVCLACLAYKGLCDGGLF